MIAQDPNALADAQEAEGEGIDVDRIREMVAFVLHAARRRPKLTAITFGVVAALGVTVAIVMPRAYVAQVKLLAQRSSTIRTLTSSNPQMDAVDNPTKNAAAMIQRRDNLVTLVKEADLVHRFEATRSPALRLKDRVSAALFGAPSAEDKQLSLVFTLEHKLDVTADENSVDISVEWSNPKIAYDLVTLVQKNFLEARYDNDVAAVNESIAVLEEHAKNELTHVDAELTEYQKVVATTAAKTVMPPTATPRGTYVLGPRIAGVAPIVVMPDPELAKALEEKRAQIRSLEEGQRHTLETLRTQLLQAQATLTPMHPAVIALQQQIDTASQPSPGLVQARSEERDLMAQIVPPRPAASPSAPQAGTGPGVRPSTSAAEADASTPDSLPALPLNQLDRDGRLQLAQSKLASAIRSYQDALARIDAARVELDITETAYKHRYTVVSPAEVPAKPKKATAQLVGVGSILGGALLAILLAAALDMAGGLILESWQVKRRLRLEVLGEFDRAS